MKKRAGILKADYDAGYGYAELTPEFAAESPLFRADVLRDWITELQEHYRVARSDMHKEWMTARANKERNEIGNTVGNTIQVDLGDDTLSN